MSGQLIRQFAYGGYTRSIMVAEQVMERGYWRVISAIDPSIKAETAAKVEAAFQGSTMLSDEVKAAVATAKIV